MRFFRTMWVDPRINSEVDVDPLVRRGIVLTGDYLTDRDILIDVIRKSDEALTAITSIENKTTGGDWDEIDEARMIANDALSCL